MHGDSSQEDKPGQRDNAFVEGKERQHMSDYRGYVDDGPGSCHVILVCR